ncbi:MAG: dihydroorotate dehydrogenase electron transfer subunit [Thermodesulfovibrionales bacterium]|nr:dihydroorotate dehydrogenase electron transfer subunit [Thermodesulfovibrionales bacterium]
MNPSISFQAEIIENTAITPDIFKLILNPLESFYEPMPGQFFMLSVSESYDPLLKRPFSVYDLKDKNLEFLYRIRGRGTGLLSEKKPGQRISVTGPFGKPYPEHDSALSVWIVAGGLGIASLNFLVQRLVSRGQKPKVFYGARTGAELIITGDIKDFCEVFTITEDGSSGQKGNVIDLFNNLIHSSPFPELIYACGPQAVLSFIDRKAQEMGVKAYLSIEERMACGMGACLGCVVKTKEGYKRVCKEGPVFREGELIW